MTLAKGFTIVPATLLAASVALPCVARADDPQTPLPVEPAGVAAPAWTGSLQDLEAANPDITNPNLIFPGQVLKLPGSADYVIRHGDTMANIAHGNDAPALAAAPIAQPEGEAPEQAPEPAPAPTVHHSGVNWDAVAACESGNNWGINTGNGFHGGLQFTLSTWRSNGGTGMPESAGRDEQIRVAENVLRTQGIKAWPVCGRRG